MMYHGKHEASKSGAKHSLKKTGVLLAALVLMISCVVGGTLAYLADSTNSVVNTFTPGKGDIVIGEEFDGQTKKNVHITNEGNVDLFIRVKVVTTWVDSNRNPIAMPEGAEVTSDLPASNKWVKHTDGYYYYNEPVAPGAKTENIIGQATYKVPADRDAMLDMQILAEGIQATDQAAKDAWNVQIANGNVTAVQKG